MWVLYCPYFLGEAVRFVDEPVYPAVGDGERVPDHRPASRPCGLRARPACGISEREQLAYFAINLRLRVGRKFTQLALE